MARLFCGPDTSPWVPIEFHSPQATAATFFEAVRRNAPNEIYRCLSAEFKQQQGLDGMVVTAAWDKLAAATPGLHLLGYAALPAAPERATESAVRYAILAEGVAIQLDLVREEYWEVRYRGSDGRTREASARITEAEWAALVQATAAEPDPVDDMPQARVSLAGKTTVHPGAGALTERQIETLAVGREWKINAISVAQK